jgi:hypothetical protein
MDWNNALPEAGCVSRTLRKAVKEVIEYAIVPFLVVIFTYHTKRLQARASGLFSTERFRHTGVEEAKLLYTDAAFQHSPINPAIARITGAVGL